MVRTRVGILVYESFDDGPALSFAEWPIVAALSFNDGPIVASFEFR